MFHFTTPTFLFFIPLFICWNFFIFNHQQHGNGYYVIFLQIIFSLLQFSFHFLLIVLPIHTCYGWNALLPRRVTAEMLCSQDESQPCPLSHPFPCWNLPSPFSLFDFFLVCWVAVSWFHCLDNHISITWGLDPPFPWWNIYKVVCNSTTTGHERNSKHCKMMN